MNKRENYGKSPEHIQRNKQYFIYSYPKRRKTVGIRITENGEVKVAAPLNIPDRQLKDIILKKLPWILRKQEELRKICEESRLENKFADGETFCILERNIL